LTKEAGNFISQSYAELRDKETESKTLPVTARTLETMIRLSTAIAKCRLSQKVEKSDAEVRLEKI
jgi:DNA replication licensing factor MCM3